MRQEEQKSRIVWEIANFCIPAFLSCVVEVMHGELLLNPLIYIFEFAAVFFITVMFVYDVWTSRRTKVVYNLLNLCSSRDSLFCSIGQLLLKHANLNGPAILTFSSTKPLVNMDTIWELSV